MTEVPPKGAWPLAAEREFWRDRAAPFRHKDWFWYFLGVGLGYFFFCNAGGENKPWFTERLHRPAVEWVQGKLDTWRAGWMAGKPVTTKVALEWPRGFGKTQVGTVGVSMAVPFAFPDASWGIGSGKIDMAAEFFDAPRAIYENTDAYAWFSWLWGNWYNPKRHWRKHSLNHAYRRNLARRDKSLFCWGVRTGITSKHPTGGSLDDPISEEWLRDDENWLTVVNDHIASINYAYGDGAFLIVPHTRYRDGDFAGKFFVEEGVRDWSGMPCPDEKIAEKGIRPDGEWSVYFIDARLPNGETSCPEIISTAELDRRQRSDPVGFAAQMRNQPGVGEHQLITMEQVNELYINSKDLPSHGFLVITLDTAFKTPETMARGDDTVAEFWLIDPRGNGLVYYLEGFGHNRYRAESFAAELVRRVRFYQDKMPQYRIMYLTDEQEVGGKAGTFYPFFKQFAVGAGILRVPPLKVLTRAGRGGKSAKHARVQRAAAYWADGRAKLVRGAPGLHHLVDQMVRWHTVKHYDWADAGADIFHDEVYRPQLLASASSSIVDNDPYQPGDDTLKDRFMHDDDRGIYDTIQDTEPV